MSLPISIKMQSSLNLNMKCSILGPLEGIVELGVHFNHILRGGVHIGVFLLRGQYLGGMCGTQQLISQTMKKSQDVSIIEMYMKPSGSCQVCMSEDQLANDYIITCEICRSCIHQSHYGSELLNQSPEIWQCERCRYFTENGVEEIKCSFCPNLRGIMKQYLFDNKKIWLHPECAAWGFPTIFFANNKKEVICKEKPKCFTTEYWVKDYEFNPYNCEICKGSEGYRIKCKYPSCTKSYHTTCGRAEGVVRDLQSMKIEGSNGYFPVYCREHIQLKIEDYHKRSKLLREKGELEKSVHFNKVSTLFTIQMKNLNKAIQKYKSEEEMISKMSIETRKKIEGTGNLSLSDIEESFMSQSSDGFLRILQENIVNADLPVQPYVSMMTEPGTGRVNSQNIEPDNRAAEQPDGEMDIENPDNEDNQSEDQDRMSDEYEQEDGDSQEMGEGEPNYSQAAAQPQMAPAAYTMGLQKAQHSAIAQSFSQGKSLLKSPVFPPRKESSHKNGERINQYEDLFEDF